MLKQIQIQGCNVEYIKREILLSTHSCLMFAESRLNIGKGLGLGIVTIILPRLLQVDDHPRSDLALEGTILKLFENLI